MNLLFVARTGVFEALTVGLSYLDKEEQLESSSVFGNMETEKKGKLIYLGKAQDGNEVYCIGNKYPDIVVRINEEIKSLIDNIASPLKVIPVSAPGTESIYTLSRLAMLPLVGNYFIRLAKSATLQHKAELISSGKNFQDGLTSKVAAKPLK
ncbi:MAG TPA: hypothetical protein DD791_06285 [Syntrophomonas sp.]|mgnify:CR=1 FL=1|jgi:hypothetical protein|nr:hypothetical protein [Syntrophomonas sp.]